MNPSQQPVSQLPPDNTTANQTPEVPERTSRRQTRRDILSIFGIIGGAVLLAFCLISFVFQSYVVDGPSMQTTLYTGDHLIVWKVPRTVARITGHPYIPHRGEIITLNKPPQAVELAHDKQLVKRVIGLPGERIVVKDGALTIYNKEHPRGFNPDKTMAYGNVIKRTPGNIDLTLGPSQIFVCGDNRANSADSRSSDIGPIDAKLIVGRLAVRVLPLQSFRTF